MNRGLSISNLSLESLCTDNNPPPAPTTRPTTARPGNDTVTREWHNFTRDDIKKHMSKNKSVINKSVIDKKSAYKYLSIKTDFESDSDNEWIAPPPPSSIR